MMSFKKDFADNLRKARIKLGFTQKDLAQQIGKSPNAVCQYEQGRRTPSLETAAHIAFVLDVSVSDLVPSSGEYFEYEIPENQTSIFDFIANKHARLSTLLDEKE